MVHPLSCAAGGAAWRRHNVSASLLTWGPSPGARAQENIDKKAAPEDWRYREAATSAFGAILEGPSLDKLAQYVAAGLGFLLNAMKDPNQQVRHTTAWTIGAPFPPGPAHGRRPGASALFPHCKKHTGRLMRAALQFDAPLAATSMP